MIAAAARHMNEVLHLATSSKHAALGVADLECARGRAKSRVAAPFPAGAMGVKEVVMRIGRLAAQNDSFAAAAGAKLPPTLRRESAARTHPGGCDGDLIGRSVLQTVKSAFAVGAKAQDATASAIERRKAFISLSKKLVLKKLAISHRRPPKQLTRVSRRRSTGQLARAGKAASVKAIASARSSARCRARLRNLDILVFLQKMTRRARNRLRAANIIYDRNSVRRLVQLAERGARKISVAAQPRAARMASRRAQLLTSLRLCKLVRWVNRHEPRVSGRDF